MKKQYSIADYKIDELLEANRSEDYHWDENHVIVDGVLMTRDSVLQTIPNTTVTAASIIKKDPQFDYSFMDTVYIRLDQMNIDHITYAHKSSTDNRKNKYHYQIDLYSAYPHVIEFERMPIDGTLYEDFTRNGEWAEFNIPMSRFATALSTITCAPGVNIFAALSENIPGV